LGFYPEMEKGDKGGRNHSELFLISYNAIGLVIMGATIMPGMHDIFLLYVRRKNQLGVN
jgi:hypothetical protein